MEASGNDLFFSPENVADGQDKLQEPRKEDEAEEHENEKTVVSEAVESMVASLENTGAEESKGDEEATLLPPLRQDEPALDYYDLLGLSTSATSVEIVAAYRRHAREVADLNTSDPLYINIKAVRCFYFLIFDIRSRTFPFLL